jgi:hypothetical protein
MSDFPEIVSTGTSVVGCARPFVQIDDDVYLVDDFLVLRVFVFFSHLQSLNNPGMNLPRRIIATSALFNGFLAVPIFLPFL